MTQKEPQDVIPGSSDDWAGQAGERWLAQLDRFEHMIAPIGEALLRQAGFAAGESVVDIGSGGGLSSLAIARLIGPQGRVLGLDVSAPLIAAARERAEKAGLSQVQFEVGDAARSMPAQAPFDRLFSRFGCMFFTEPVPAFINLRRMVRPGGRLDIVVWASAADNPWSSAVLEVIARHMPVPEPVPGAPGPFALGDEQRLRTLLDDSGWQDVQVTAWQGDLLIGGAGSDAGQAAQFVLGSMNIGERVRAADASLQAAVMADFVRLFQAHQRTEGVVMQGKAWLVRARS